MPQAGLTQSTGNGITGWWVTYQGRTSPRETYSQPILEQVLPKEQGTIATSSFSTSNLLGRLTSQRLDSPTHLREVAQTSRLESLPKSTTLVIPLPGTSTKLSGTTTFQNCISSCLATEPTSWLPRATGRLHHTCDWSMQLA